LPPAGERAMALRAVTILQPCFAPIPLDETSEPGDPA